MGRPRNRTFVQAKESATGTHDGAPFVIQPGELFDEDHPIVRSYPHFFKAAEPTRKRPVVEQMTAAPGEQRGGG